jgi:hypothetical protein
MANIFRVMSWHFMQKVKDCFLVQSRMTHSWLNYRYVQLFDVIRVNHTIYMHSGPAGAAVA